MEDLPGQWRRYARIQGNLAGRDKIDDYAWGLEAALNKLLLSEGPNSEDDVGRVVQSESRRERHRAALRRAHLNSFYEVPSPEVVADARQQLRLIRGRVTAEEWTLLRAVGTGMPPKQIAAERRKPAGALRVHLFRLRDSLRTLAAR